jgi:hypothetical protein
VTLTRGYCVPVTIPTHGMETKFDLPPRTEPTPEDGPVEDPKWRICQNFSQIDKITKIAPMPQGDIRAKQQWLSGHRYVSGFDFAASDRKSGPVRLFGPWAPNRLDFTPEP